MAGSTKSVQLGTYVTMIVGLLFLFLVVSQAGKYRKDGAVVTSAKERAALLDERQKTLLKIGAMPVPGQENPLAGMPGTPMQSTSGIPGQSRENPQTTSQRQTLVSGTTPGTDTQSMQGSINRLLNTVRQSEQNPGNPTPPQQTTQRPEQQPQQLAQNPAPQKRQYLVRQNDTLYGIALKVYGNGNLWRDILKANPEINPNRLSQGQKISIPEPDRPSAAFRRWSSGNEG